MERRLAAIFAADVVGYSRLMGEDEAGTLNALKALRKDLVAPAIAGHKGRVVKLMGDGLLAEFGSVVGAVECAVAIQTAMPQRNAARPPERRIELRIGINLGEVIVEGRDIYGDGVNVAARLEALAEPGGICIADRVHEQVEGRFDCRFTDAGEQTVKNIARPVRVWRWSDDSEAQSNGPRTGEALSLPNKPSIAVLPFTNMSGDPEKEYFSDGITEDIITELARFNSLFIISRNSSFQYKGRSPNVQDVGRELGVLYVVEGSVRRAGNRVRITAQLIEAQTGNHIWAERYDRSLDDIFAVQDDVVSGIAMMVSGRIDVANRIKSDRKPTNDISAYDLALRADWLTFNDRNPFEAVKLLEKAIDIDPEFALAHAKAAELAAWGVFVRGLDIDEARAITRKHGETATRLAPGDGLVNATLAEAYGIVGEHKLAAHHADVAMALNPNAFFVMAFVGWVKGCQGDYEGGSALLEKAMRNDPYSAIGVRENKVDVYYIARRYEDCVEQLVGWPNPPLHTELAVAAALAQLDRIDEAEAIVRKVTEAAPEYWDIVKVCHAYKNMCARPEDGEHWLEGFRKAGLPV